MPANAPASKSDQDKSKDKKDKVQFVNSLALAIVLLSAGILTLLIIMAAFNLGKADSSSFANVKELLSILLPLVGTWMGTILAFYFSRDNFESANKSVQQMVKQMATADEKLQVLNVSDVMIKPDESTLYLVENEEEFKSLNLTDLLGKMEKSHSERMPILQDDTLMFIFLIYRSTLERFMIGYGNGTIKLNAAADTPKPAAELQVADMFNSDFKLIKDITTLDFEKYFMPITTTLDKVKQAMQDNSICQDVFITQTGRKDEPILGWITNNMIIEKAELFKKAGTDS